MRCFFLAIHVTKRHLVLSNQIKSNLFAQQLTLYRQNHIHLHVLKTYYIIILQIHGYIK